MKSNPIELCFGAHDTLIFILFDAGGLYIKDDAHTFGARAILNVGGVFNGALSLVVPFHSSLSFSLRLNALGCVCFVPF